MDEQLTIRLPKELGCALRAAAVRTNRRRSEIVRLALRDYLGLSGSEGARAEDRISALLGSLESAIPDLATRSRKYVVESIRRRR